eukprot:5874867-Amphidinium_carterae.1
MSEDGAHPKKRKGVVETDSLQSPDIVVVRHPLGWLTVSGFSSPRGLQLNAARRCSRLMRLAQAHGQA